MGISFAPRSLCRNCGATIEFRRTPREKWQPVDPDGTPHFATCSARVDKPRPPDDVCIQCGSFNVERSPGKGPHYTGLRCQDCSAFRWLRAPQ